MANSIWGVGQWTLSFYGHHLEILKQPSLHQPYENICEVILGKAIDMLDCDNPKVGRPLLQYLTNWIQAHSKMVELSEPVMARFHQILSLVYKRFAYPAWCSLVEDPIDDRELDYMQYRAELMTTFINLAMIRTFHHQVCQSLFTLASQVCQDVR